MRKFFKNLGLKEHSRSRRQRDSQSESPLTSSPITTPDRVSTDVATQNEPTESHTVPQSQDRPSNNWQAVHQHNMKGVIKTFGDYPFAHGGFSDIWRGTWSRKDKDIQVAVKVLKPYEKADEDLFHELSVWAPHVHKNIARCFGYLLENTSDGIYAALITEWHPSGTVIEYLQERPEVDRLFLSIQSAEGVQYLHSLRPFLIHGDLKGANILISVEGIPKLCDFGLAELMQDTFQRGTSSAPRFGKGSTRWASQELFSNTRGHKSRASDVWALASLVLEIMTGKIPYHRQADVTVVRAITRGRLPSPEDYEELPADSPMWSLFQTCWKWWPELRPSVDVFVSHLKDLNNTALLQQLSNFDEDRRDDWIVLSNRQLSDPLDMELIAETEVDSHISKQTISMDGHYIAIPGFRTSIDLFDNNLNYICSLQNDDRSAVGEIAFAPSSKIIAGGANNRSTNPIILWEVTTPKLVGELYGHSQPVESLVFTLDDRWLISTSEDLSLRVWDIRNDLGQVSGLELDGNAYDLVVSPDCSHVAASTASGVRIWGLGRTGQLSAPVTCLSWLIYPSLRSISMKGVKGLVIHGKNHARASFWPFTELTSTRFGEYETPPRGCFEIFDIETTASGPDYHKEVPATNKSDQLFAMMGLGGDIVMWSPHHGGPGLILRDMKEAIRDHTLVSTNEGYLLSMRRQEKLLLWRIKRTNSQA